jgi:hypothetical protein
MDRHQIFCAIEEERFRQEKIHPLVKLNIKKDDESQIIENYFLSQEFLAVLGEEFGEVCRCLQGENETSLADELIQVASVCVRWLENLK